MCVLVLDHAHWLGPKQNTQNIYLQADDKWCTLLLLLFPLSMLLR